MSPGLLALLVGLFAVPSVLLWWSHGLRRLPPRRRRVFWGAIIGHCVAGIVAVTVGVIIPEAWTAGDTLRGAAGLWSLLVFPLVGGAAAALFPSSSR